MRGNQQKEIEMKLTLMMLLCAVMLTGCLTEDKKQVIKDKVHTAIIEYVQGKGKDKAIAYIDKLVAEGKLGAKNAEKIKNAIPQGIEKLKEVMGEIEKEESK